MLYLDYGKQEGGWIPNKYGGRENLDAVSFLRDFNSAVKKECPGCFTCAEESTAWPRVTGPVDEGGLGFTFKWNMGWMHDTLEYMTKDPVYRSYEHSKLTFGMLYQYSEDFILPLSHDEIVYGKRSLLNKMPGDDWRRYANLRAFYGYMIGYPGKKLLMMGSEFAQFNEWNARQSLDWHLLDEEQHKQMQLWCEHLNNFYKTHSELWELDNSPGGFTWLQCEDRNNSVVIFNRYPLGHQSVVMVVCNFTPVPRTGYRVGLPVDINDTWKLELNSDDRQYGGSGFGAIEELQVQQVPFSGQPLSLELTIPPMACLFYTAQALVDPMQEQEQMAEGNGDGNPESGDERVKFSHELK